MSAGIVEYKWFSGTSTVITLPSGTSSYTSNRPINGMLMGFEWKTPSTGSLFVTASGTNRLIYTNLAPSGTNWQKANMQEFAAVGSQAAYIYSFEPLILGISGSQSGTTLPTIDCTMRFWGNTN